VRRCGDLIVFWQRCNPATAPPLRGPALVLKFKGERNKKPGRSGRGDKHIRARPCRAPTKAWPTRGRMGGVACAARPPDKSRGRQKAGPTTARRMEHFRHALVEEVADAGEDHG